MTLKDDWEPGDTYTAEEANLVAKAVNVAVSDFDLRLDDNRTPADGSVTLDKLHDSLSTGVSGLGSPYFSTSTQTVLNADNDTDATQKYSLWGTPHYTNTENPVIGLRVVSGETSNTVSIGGGTGVGNAATTVSIYTAGDTSTTAGTLRTSIAKTGTLTHLFDAFIGDTTDTTSRQLGIRSAAGQSRLLGFYTGSSSRWLLKCNSDSESGSDAGSNLVLESRTDAGGFTIAVFCAHRATGEITLGAKLKANAGISTSAISISSGGAPAAADSTGTAGTVAWDSGYLYVCISTNTWVRTSLTTWP